MTEIQPRVYTFSDAADTFAPKAARYVVRRFSRYGVEHEDVLSEIQLWLYGQGRDKVERWLANDPQQTTRVYREMVDAGLRYAEAEKAQQVGYAVTDLYWYTPRVITAVMPHVLNADFTEEGGRIGELITTVLDIRSVMTADDRLFFLESEASDAGYSARVRLLMERLGSKHRPFARRAQSNAQARAALEDS